MAVLPSNPEVLLRKRKNADRKRIEKSDAARARKEKEARKAKTPRDKFYRAEFLVLRNKAHALEDKRIHNIIAHESKNARISAGKDAAAKLLFVVRIPPVKRDQVVSKKADEVLRVMRLTEPNLGVFVRSTPAVQTLLKLVAPYVVVGQPSLASVRTLFQKRACLPTGDEEQPTTKLDNNQAVEDKFGDDLGLICIEDVVHEIVTLGDNFKAVTQWLAPFPLTAPVQGYTPMKKLARIRYEEENQKQASLVGHAKVAEVDIDKFIAEQN